MRGGDGGQGDTLSAIVFGFLFRRPRRLGRFVLAHVAAWVVILTVALGGYYWAAYGGRLPMRAGPGPRPGVQTVVMHIVSAFILDAGPGKVALIDTGTAGTAGTIVDALRARGLGPEAVQAVFITHHHRDHVGGLVRFPNAEVYALASEHEDIAQHGVRASRAVADGEVVTVGPLSVKVYAVPGHTEGSAAFLAYGTLFLGDAGSIRSDGTVRGPFSPFSRDADRSLQELRALAQRLRGEHAEVSAIVFSHSGPIEEDALDRLAQAH
jgi:glyoxylase-like metal-dependent hydrolase (beta-lactamase superfamily II)